MKKTDLRVALVADWLTIFGGAESVIESFARIFPEAPIFVPVFFAQNFPKSWKKRVVAPTFLQKLPAFVRRRHPLLFPFLPRAVEKLDLRGFDLVLSSSSFVGKGVLTTPDQLHICYCHAPTRYLWGEWQAYIRDFPIPNWLKKMLPPLLTRMRKWDFTAAQRPDFFLANSDFVAQGIKKYYRRDAEVIPPPVDNDFFAPKKSVKKEEYFLYFGRLVPQKRVDLLIDAFRKIPHQKLVIAGTGRSEAMLREKALGMSNVEFRGFVPNEEKAELFQKARALLFPQKEDAGITALEALAAETSIIAFGAGGALTLLDTKTAVFFDAQTPIKIISALEEWEKKSFSAKDLRNRAEKFSRKIFEKRIRDFVMSKVAERKEK